MSEAMEAEFGALAGWTAEVAADLGPDYYVPAGCRGSGSPAALDWLMDRMDLTPSDVLLDCGAGVGGPAAYAAEASSVHPVLVEPEAGACSAAKSLFGYPVIRAVGTALPLGDASVDAAWSLGVLCTVSDQLVLLTELGRVLRPGGRIGLLVFVRHGRAACEQLQDNNFPTPNRLLELVGASSLHLEEKVATAELPGIPDVWNRRVDEVTRVLADRHGHSPTWQLAERQSSTIGRLLNDGHLTGELLVLRQA